ncbi:hypothetical protein THAOC_24410 [Thalassiosira oceanica]|uniref:Uncharacterized protein n=1 Tax=Thalassiosira oceanica TaxID=159749 RepID=K0RPW8_THAOC|nr:hypothetical protein THAOC_24410 [Thalassiosira oceanica]|eukprot:EJK55813.1 hypothetical protein THAOC_24410 [Thalassiosira oceanica]
MPGSLIPYPSVGVNSVNASPTFVSPLWRRDPMASPLSPSPASGARCLKSSRGRPSQDFFRHSPSWTLGTLSSLLNSVRGRHRPEYPSQSPAWYLTGKDALSRLYARFRPDANDANRIAKSQKAKGSLEGLNLARLPVFLGTISIVAQIKEPKAAQPSQGQRP